jgi:DNA-binding NarL/FixJ family response regulator
LIALEIAMRQALLMSDQPEIADSVRNCLEASGYFLALASGQLWSLSVVELLKPDIILWDVTSTQNEAYQFSEVLRAHPVLCTIPLIVISKNSTYAERVSALKAGTDLIVDSTFLPEELLAMTDALVNQSVRLRRHSVTIQSRLEPTMTLSPEGFPVVLTSCETPILKRVARGEHNKEIAAALGVSRRTVESHITNMLSKTGLNNRTQLARWAMEHHDVHPVFSTPNPYFRP